MISITYQADIGPVTVTTNAGDQQDDEPADMVQRQAQRLAAAMQMWPKV